MTNTVLCVHTIVTVECDVHYIEHFNDHGSGSLIATIAIDELERRQIRIRKARARDFKFDVDDVVVMINLHEYMHTYMGYHDSKSQPREHDQSDRAFIALS